MNEPYQQDWCTAGLRCHALRTGARRGRRVLRRRAIATGRGEHAMLTATVRATVVMVVTRVREQAGRKAVGADLERQWCSARGHEACGDEQLQRQRRQQREQCPAAP